MDIKQRLHLYRKFVSQSREDCVSYGMQQILKYTTSLIIRDIFLLSSSPFHEQIDAVISNIICIVYESIERKSNKESVGGAISVKFNLTFS